MANQRTPDTDQAVRETIETVDPQIEADRRLIKEAQAKGRLATLGAYVRLSGPGWLQSAITLGGGSLSSSLYLGVLAGFSLLWLQPLAMIIGVIMLSAIAYVTLSTGERPFQAINKHVNPVLGWGWLIATLMANCVWSLPQFALAAKAFRQNLMPSVFGIEVMAPNTANGIIVGAVALLCITMVFFYDKGGWGATVFDVILKAMVGVVVVSFFGVVVYLSAKGTLDWGAIGHGFIPDITLLWSPTDSFMPYLDDVAAEFRQFWSDMIVADQQDSLVAAAATAVGINMTFLLPYSMLKKGWNKTFRGLAIFDLSTGLFVPFILATGCVIIASASRFHTTPAVHFPKPDTLPAVASVVEGPAFAALDEAAQREALRGILDDGYLGEESDEKVRGKLLTVHVTDEILEEVNDPAFADLSATARRNVLRDALLGADPSAVKAYRGNALKRIKEEIGGEALAAATAGDTPVEVKAREDALIADLSLADRRMAAMLVRRDNIHLATALKPLTGPLVAQYIFGIGVVGMAISSVIILMLINGFCICEAVNRPSKGWLYRVGCLIPAIGVLGPFIWAGAAPYLALPTSVFGFILIPIAYTTFALLLNQRKLLGDNMPRGTKRWIWNTLMFLGVAIVLIGSVYKAWQKTRDSFLGSGWYGAGAIIAFVAAVVIVHFIRKKRGKEALL
ncbi:MAG: divalent metal cation transporter [Phycisphaerae bacterium]